MTKKYDYLIVGAGLFGATFAHEAKKAGKKCLVIDKRDHIAGNIFTENINGINVHKYGAHIFHTSNEVVWNYINQFTKFNRYTNSPIAIFEGKAYNLPFNMNTFYQLWGTITPKQAAEKITNEIAKANITKPTNLEEQAISLVGETIYRKLIKGYTEKQWGKKATDLPTGIITRLPTRFTYDNNYFNDNFQGIPIGGYTQIVEKMLDGTEVRLNYDYFIHKSDLDGTYNKLIFTGPIDQFFNYKYGSLEYRSLRFKTKLLEDQTNYQGNAVVNYTEFEVPYTRIIEHKHFESADTNCTIITEEYPDNWRVGKEAYYTINDGTNAKRYSQYYNLSKTRDFKHITFAGRLGEYKYYDMDDTIESALTLSKKLLS